MTAPTLGSAETVDHVFPTLTDARVARVAKYGRARAVAAGEILLEPGTPNPHCFVVTRGSLEILRPSREGDTVLTVARPGQFTGEANILTGRRALARIRVLEDSEVIELDRDQMLRLLQTDADVGEIITRAFILRRAQLIARGLGDVVLVGSTH